MTILAEVHQKQKEFQESEYFKERSRERYKIEAKNAELKQSHGLDTADSVGLSAMRLQLYFTAVVANVKRIVKLNEALMASVSRSFVFSDFCHAFCRQRANAALSR